MFYKGIEINVSACSIQINSFVLPLFHGLVSKWVVVHAAAEYRAHANLCYHEYVVSSLSSVPMRSRSAMGETLQLTKRKILLFKHNTLLYMKTLYVF